MWSEDLPDVPSTYAMSHSLHDPAYRFVFSACSMQVVQLHKRNLYFAAQRKVPLIRMQNYATVYNIWPGSKKSLRRSLH
jgi:hypothetical protein